MKENFVHPTALLIGKVEMGIGNYFGPGCLIVGPITIGDNNFFGAQCVVGTPPEDDVISVKEHISSCSGEIISPGSISIGDNNIIREFVSINRGETSTTEIFNDVFLMAYSHIAHDCKNQSKAKITNAVQLGGYTTIGYAANIGLSSTLHQWTVVGAFAMIGMNSTVTRNIPPGSLAFGTPAKVKGPNIFSLEKLGIDNYDFWDEYIADLDCNTIPSKLISHVEFFKKEEEDKIELQSISRRWRNDQSTKNSFEV